MDSGEGDAVQRASRFADADSQSRPTPADHPSVSKLTGTARSRSRSTVNRPPQLEEDPSVLNTLRKRLQGEEGFTLVELLVVILIIGILAAIAIPSFLNQKGKGEDAAAKSSAREAATALETYYTDNGSYSRATGTAPRQIEAPPPQDRPGGGRESGPPRRGPPDHNR